MERFDVHRDSEDFPNEGKHLAAKKHYYKNNNVVIFIYFSTVNFNIIKLLLVSLWEFLTLLSLCSFFSYVKVDISCFLVPLTLNQKFPGSLSLFALFIP